MSDTFDHELDAFESAYDQGLLILPQDVENFLNIDTDEDDQSQDQ